MLVEGIPQLTLRDATELRRLITLVDALYDARTLLVVSAAVPLESLFLAEGTDAHADKFGDVIGNIVQARALPSPLLRLPSPPPPLTLPSSAAHPPLTCAGFGRRALRGAPHALPPARDALARVRGALTRQSPRVRGEEHEQARRQR